MRRERVCLMLPVITSCCRFRLLILRDIRHSLLSLLRHADYFRRRAMPYHYIDAAFVTATRHTMPCHAASAFHAMPFLVTRHITLLFYCCQQRHSVAAMPLALSPLPLSALHDATMLAPYADALWRLCECKDDKRHGTGAAHSATMRGGER